MESKNIEKVKEAIDNLVQAFYEMTKSIANRMYNALKNVMKEFVYKNENKEIRKRINIYNRTKSYRIKKKQMKLIWGEIWD